MYLSTRRVIIIYTPNGKVGNEYVERVFLRFQKMALKSGLKEPTCADFRGLNHDFRLYTESDWIRAGALVKPIRNRAYGGIWFVGEGISELTRQVILNCYCSSFAERLVCFASLESPVSRYMQVFRRRRLRDRSRPEVTLIPEVGPQRRLAIADQTS